MAAAQQSPFLPRDDRSWKPRVRGGPRSHHGVREGALRCKLFPWRHAACFALFVYSPAPPPPPRAGGGFGGGGRGGRGAWPCLFTPRPPLPASLVPLIEVLRRDDSVPVGLVCDRATAVSSAAVRVWTVAKRANLTSSHHTHAAGNYTCGGDAFGTYSACCLNVPSHLSSGRRGLEGARTVLRGREEANRREAGRADLRL